MKEEKLKKEPLDVKYLGQKYPGTPRQRQRLLEDLQELLQEEGEEFVRKSAKRLLAEAQFLVDAGAI